MTPNWSTVKEVFARALECPSAERDSFLNESCAGDEGLRRAVLNLISAHEASGDFLKQSALVDLRFIGGDDPRSAAPGQKIGSYRIIRELGRGGMGAVYLAARADESFDKQVALKVIRRGMDSDAITKRFVMERQILANLDHPNIARLIDGGTTEDGRPYFVLEYIEGETISHYCDDHRLNTTERLKLFRNICAAVQFAHQNLIVHRDLKPSNILVTENGTPKLLDFGIAKLLGPDWSSPADATETIARLLTPEYASPEQLRGLPMTTTSDVYSLGVVLYELLSGHRPFRSESRSPEELARLITTSEPIKPSAIIARRIPPKGTGAEAQPSTAEEIGRRREGNIERLRRRLAGDLDNILLKALRKEPERRYASVQEFSEDLRRHLDGLPVQARPDTLSYRTSKFITRHKAGVAAALVVVLTLLSATVITSWQNRVARQERAKAERRFKDVRNLANSFLFDFHDAIADLNGATKAREMVASKAQEYLDSLAREAGDDRELLWELSTAYLKLGDVQGQPGFSRTGDTAAARRSYEYSLEIRRQLVNLEPNNSEYQLGVAVTLARFGPLFQVLGQPGMAADRMRESKAIADKLLPNAHDLPTFQIAFRSRAFLGDALAELGNYDESLLMYQEALAIADRMKAESLPEKDVILRYVVARERLGFAFITKGEWQKAIECDLEMLANTEQLLAIDPASLDYARDKATALDHVGDSYRSAKNYPKAIEYGRRGLSMYEQILKRDAENARAKKDYGDCTHHVAETLLASGDHRDALALLEKTVSTRRGLVALDTTNVEYPDDLAESLLLTGEGLAGGRNFTKAIEVFQEARAIKEPIVLAHSQRIDYRRGLARLYTDMGNTFVALKNDTEAETCYHKALDLWVGLQNQNALWAKEMNMPKDVAQSLSRKPVPN